MKTDLSVRTPMIRAYHFSIVRMVILIAAAIGLSVFCDIVDGFFYTKAIVGAVVFFASTFNLIVCVDLHAEAEAERKRIAQHQRDIEIETIRMLTNEKERP